MTETAQGDMPVALVLALMDARIARAQRGVLAAESRLRSARASLQQAQVERVEAERFASTLRHVRRDG